MPANPPTGTPAPGTPGTTDLTGPEASARGGSDRPLVLVFGASGYIGTWLVPRLLTEPVRVRAAARRLDVLEAQQWPGVECVAADALKPDSLADALAGVDVAWYLVHSMDAGQGFGSLDLEAAGNFAEAAAAAGLHRIVYLGGLVPDAADSEHIVSRAHTGDRLREGTVPVTEIRAGIIIGPGSAAFEVMRDLILHLPAMVTPRWVRAKSPPIALDNLLEYLVRTAFLDEAAGRIFDAGGPEIVTYEHMMRELADAAGKRCPPIIPVPVLTPRLSSYWLGLVTAVPANVAKALIGGLKHDFAADDAALRRMVPQRLLSVREAIDAAFAAERHHRVAARWQEGSFPARDFSHDVAYYAKRAGGQADSSAAPDAVWAQVAAIGGRNRYYFANWLWTIRELMDWCIGGPGRSHGRRDQQSLRLGDTVDSWTAIHVDEPRDDGGSTVRVTAYWHPRGFWGLAYWYALVPAHLFLFRGWTRVIARRAETGETGR